MSATSRAVARPPIAGVAMTIAMGCALAGALVVCGVALVVETEAPIAWLAASLSLGVVTAGALAFATSRAMSRSVERCTSLVEVVGAAAEGAPDGVALEAAAITSSLDSPLVRDVRSATRRIAERLERIAAATGIALAAATQEQRGKMQFFATMSHDLRGPLASIIGFSDLLDVDASLAPEQRQSVVQIRVAAKALLVLVDDLLDAARLEAGRIVLRPGWTPVVDVWRDAMSVDRARSVEHGVRVEAEMEAGLPPTWVDAARSRQALALLADALMRSLKMGKLVLRASTVRDLETLPASVRARGAQGRFVRIDLDDRHAARDATLHAQIIASLTGAIGGSKPEGSLGLRLSLAVALVEIQGGWVACSSRADGSHVVSIALPLEPP